MDGDDNVWVANFDGRRLSHICGREPANCPPGPTTGSPISPATGYAFDGLTRNTAVEIDPSGNVRVTNNWKNRLHPRGNPGGYQMVVFVGCAAGRHPADRPSAPAVILGPRGGASRSTRRDGGESLLQYPGGRRKPSVSEASAPATATASSRASPQRGPTTGAPSGNPPRSTVRENRI